MGKRKTFIITGGCTYGVDNHGDDAMLSCLVRGLKKKYNNPKIIFLARHPNKKFDNLYKFKSLKNLDHDHKDLAKNRFFLGMNFNDKTEHLKKISKAMSKADMLIVGGNLFMEVHKNSFLEWKIYSVGAKVLGKRLCSRLLKAQAVQAAARRADDCIEISPAF